MNSHFRAFDPDLDRFLDHFQRRKRPAVHFGSRAWRPLVDLFETAGMVVAIIELAGVQQDQVEVTVRDQALIIRGERAANPSEHRPHQHHLIEIASGPFERVIPLPAGVDAEHTSAAMRDGLLEVCMPKLKRERIVVEVQLGR